MALLKAILRGDVEAVRTKFNHVDWNFAAPVVGRTAAQSPLALLLRPELNYGNLSRMSSAQQKLLVEHALSLDLAFTPRLDSLNHAKPEFRQTMSSHVIQAVYQGNVKLVQLLYEESIERERQGTGVKFNLRDVFFNSKITLLHMAAHDGQLDMCRWLLSRWDEERERDPNNVELNSKFTAEVLDGENQTPLFWTFARGNVNVDLARFFVEERGCDLFRVFPLYSQVPVPVLDASGRPTMELDAKTGKETAVTRMERRFDGHVSAFSLPIQLAPDFVEEQLRSKSVNMGCRFQMQVMKFSFEGITLRTEQVQRIQARVDELNAEHTGGLGGNEFLNKAKEQLEVALVKAIMQADKEKAAEAPQAGTSDAAASPSGAVAASAGGDSAAPASSSVVLRGDDVEELRFLPQESQSTRLPRNGWDTFFYDPTPLSALELMVLHRRRRMLLTPIMSEIRHRLWDQLSWEYYCLVTCFSIFGLLFAINTAFWPRTAELLRRSNDKASASAQVPSDSESDRWIAQYCICNLLCALLSLVFAAFYVKVVYEGPHRRTPSLTQLRDRVKDALRTVGRNALVAFAGSSARIDVAIIVAFWLVQSLQWSMLCHVPQFVNRAQCSGPDTSLSADHVGALAWLSVALHLLLGAKLLELLSVVNWAGPLFSTLVGMMQDVGRFLALFCVGFAAFACAGWIVLKDQFGEAFDASLGLDGPAASASTEDGGPSFSYGRALITQLLWVFMDYDFDGLLRTPVKGVSVLGGFLLLSFLLVLVLVMLNVMIAMFSNTYADVVKESEGEAALRRTALIVQLLRLAGGNRSRDARRFVAGMAVDNNCGIDRPTLSDSAGAINAETNAAVASGATVARDGSGGNWAETVNEHFMQLGHQLARMRADINAIKAQVADSQAENKKLAAALAATGAPSPSPAEQLH